MWTLRIFGQNGTISILEVAKYKYLCKFKLVQVYFSSFLVDLRLRILGCLVVKLRT